MNRPLTLAVINEQDPILTIRCAARTFFNMRDSKDGQMDRPTCWHARTDLKKKTGFAITMDQWISFFLQFQTGRKPSRLQRMRKGPLLFGRLLRWNCGQTHQRSPAYCTRSESELDWSLSSTMADLAVFALARKIVICQEGFILSQQ